MSDIWERADLYFAKISARANGEQQLTQKQSRDLGEAAYTCCEGGNWPDGFDKMSNEQIMFSWHLVEEIKKNGFPEDLIL